MAKLIKNFFVFVYFVIALATLVFGSGYFFYTFGHFLILAGWVFLVVKRHLKSKHSMKGSLGFFLVGSFLNVFGFRDFGEELMRIFFILFSVGLIQAFLETRGKKHVKTS